MGWEEVRDTVLSRIRARIWAPGALIPGEEALAVEFGIARATVNRALTELARSGVIERKRRAGTRVAALPIRRATFDIPVIRAEVQGRGQAYAIRLIRQEQSRPPLDVALRLGWPLSGAEVSGAMLCLETLHLADGAPFAHELRWLNPAVLPDPRPDFTAISANEWLVAHVPFVTGDIAFSAEPAAPEVAAAMGLAPGAPVFVTERCTWGERAPVTWVRLTHAPGYRLQTVI
ncbi:GntR family transcriptional regulator [Rhodobacter sp. KR11]|uniref:GntR family transcriptional regulator n=1 Tax=Rhodobacter sp. KR11 TaxID=2974588 RepID=UPI002223D627|nr:GntR family transcriptional regulator [Rhodobacter sp. KR11]MCW1919629.1 GntR family transcriptional regulator [Rhodobacter sp. KR11]